MTLRDYAAVAALWRATPGLGWDEVSDARPAIARFLKRNPGQSFVACAQGAIVGAVLSGHDGRRGFLYHLAVAPAHRRAGVGKALVARCLQGLGRQGIPKCSIFVFRSNIRGRKFWKHNGWNLRPDLCVLQQKTEYRKQP